MEEIESVRKTRRSYNIPGHAHFLTYSTVHRLPLLANDELRRSVIGAIEKTRREQNAAIWAYVIMPEHVHVLLQPRKVEYEMRTILAALKRPVSAAARQRLESAGDHDMLQRLTVTYPIKTTFRFWQPGGGFDNNIFKWNTVKRVIDYIHANPVRRGLVTDPQDWRWSSARWWSGDRDVPLQMDRPGE